MSATAKMMAFLGLDPKDFNKGVDQAHAKVRTFGGVLDGMKGRLAAAFTVGAIASGIKSVIESAGDLIHAAENLRVTTDEYQALASAARRLGVEEEALSAVLGRVMKAQEEASSANPSEEMVKAFDALGISIADLDRLDPAQVFDRIAAAASRGSTEMAAAFKLMGKGGFRFRGLMDEVGGTGLEAMIAKAKANGKIIGEAELEGMHQAELAAKSGWSWMKKLAGKAIGAVIIGATGAGVGATPSGRQDMSAANERARQMALDEKARAVMQDADEIRRKTAFDLLSATEKRAALEAEIADIDRQRMGLITEMEYAQLDKQRAELESKLAGLDETPGGGIVSPNFTALERIGAVGGVATNQSPIPQKTLTVMQKMQADISKLVAYAAKQKSGVF